MHVAFALVVILLYGIYDAERTVCGLGRFGSTDGKIGCVGNVGTVGAVGVSSVALGVAIRTGRMVGETRTADSSGVEAAAAAAANAAAVLSASCIVVSWSQSALSFGKGGAGNCTDMVAACYVLLLCVTVTRCAVPV